MMATYRELQDKINLDYLNNTTVVAETKRAIQSSIRCYESTRFWFNEAATAVATVAGQSYIAVPTDFLTVDRLDIAYTSGNYNELPRESFAFVQNQNTTSVTSQPTAFTYWNDRLELANIPNAVYAVNLYYIKKLATLSADSDTNAWTNEAFNLIAHAATVELLSNVLQIADQDRISRHEFAKQRAQTELAGRNDQKFFTHLTPTYF